MTTATHNSSFLDSTLARIIALLLALFFAFILYSNWSGDFRNLFSSSSTQENSTTEQATTDQPAKPINEKLEACLTQRVGDVDRMKSEGILSDSQYAKFKSRAEDLCKAQNPG